MQADIHGHQRKVVRSRVRPARSAYTESGILLRDGRSLPFKVERGWNAPAGHYTEQWYLVHPKTREVLFEGPRKNLSVWGLQSITDLVDEIRTPLRLAAGTYLIVFALAGVRGGELEVEAREAPAEEAA